MTQSVYNVVLGETAEGSLMNLLSKEEQRYGRNKETVINRSYIESGEYRKKFDRISDNAELNKLLYQLAKKDAYPSFRNLVRGHVLDRPGHVGSGSIGNQL